MTAPLTVPNVLRRAAAILTEAGWCQFQLRDEHGRVCVQGAVERAVVEAGGSVVGNTFADAMRELDTVAVMPRHVPPGQRVRWFNDAPGRTVRQVRNLLLRAATNAEVDDKGAGMNTNSLSERAAS